MLKKMIRKIFYETEGEFTRELAQAPSSLGLGQLPRRLMPDETVCTVCGFCSTGCSLEVHLKDGQPVNLTPALHYPVNLGEACPKGWEALTPLKAPDRATRPYLRNSHGKLVAVDWEEALTTFVNRFTRIQREHGPESIAFLSTGQIPTEEMAFLGVLAKFGMGMLHGDSNTRQCMATAAVAYKESFGFDAPPYTYKDFEESDVLVFVGGNPCIAHPVLWQRVMMNRRSPEIIVVDPRKTETAMSATRHYAIQPKSDLALFYGLANVLIENDWIDEAFIERHTQGFDEFRRHVSQYPVDAVSRTTGLSVEQIQKFAALIRRGKRVSFWWTMGVNQSYEGVRTAQALINLALITGNIGKPGTGANSITGQCNAMGSRLFSNTTNLFGGHDFGDADDRQRVADILGIEESRIPRNKGWAYDQIIEGIARDKIKGLWVIATNPVHSWINHNELKWILNKLDFLVVQDMYLTTETAQAAHLILPAAGWGEKDGTFINSERRLGRVRKVAEPPGQALSDFEIFRRVAKYWGCERIVRHWKTPQDVFHTLKVVSRGRPYDFSGIEDWDMLEAAGGIQWPFPEGAHLDDNERRLFSDGKFFHADGRAHLLFEQPRPLPEPTDGRYPFTLLTGRGTSAQWHTQTRTSKSLILQKMYPKDVYVEINPIDAKRQSIYQGEWVYVSTRRAQVRARAHVLITVRPGQIFMPMHYPETNQLTLAAFDAYSRQPSYKICAASISKGAYSES